MPEIPPPDLPGDSGYPEPYPFPSPIGSGSGSYQTGVSPGNYDPSLYHDYFPGDPRYTPGTVNPYAGNYSGINSNPGSDIGWIGNGPGASASAGYNPYQNTNYPSPGTGGPPRPGSGFSPAYLNPITAMARLIRNAAHNAAERNRTRQNMMSSGQRQQSASAPAWFQRGYQLPAGIQGAINRGDYTTAYGQSPSSRANSMQMWAASVSGSPNRTRVNDQERIFNSASGITPGNRTGRGQALQALYPRGVSTGFDPNTNRPVSSYPQTQPFSWLNLTPPATISPPPTMPPTPQPGQGRFYGGDIGLPPGIEIGGNNLWDTGSDLLGPPIWQGGGPDPVWNPPNATPFGP